MIHTRNASLAFAGKLMAWGAFAVVSLTYVVFIVAKLSMSFFKANGMINSEEIIEAIYINIFSVEPVFFFMLLIGFAGVGMTAFMFGNSQFNYFKKLSEALGDLSRSGGVSCSKNLGPFAKNFNHFKEVIQLRFEKIEEAVIKDLINKNEKMWPKSPLLSWLDQLQFAIVAILIAGFFTMLSVIFFWKVTDRLIELSGALIRYKSTNGPKFFLVQNEIVSLVMWTVFVLMIGAYAQAGFAFGRKVSEAGYAVLRDMRRFMSGELDHRIVLRGDDPAKVYMPEMNEALSRIADRIKNQ
jgi:methyl-accepting chemotaxis protein